jgi:NADP-dependent 3-hydroxy acid dehydrogenase YdfG
MLDNNNGKVAIVTGASSGIGYATSLALSKAGLRVAVGARRMERLQDLEEQIVKNHEVGKGRKKKIYLYKEN